MASKARIDGNVGNVTASTKLSTPKGTAKASAPTYGMGGGLTRAPQSLPAYGGPTSGASSSVAPPPTGIEDKGLSPIGGGGGGAFAPDALTATAPAVSEEDYLAGESGYQAQLAALMKALSDYDTDITRQKTTYDTDYGKALGSLGWKDADNNLETPEGEWNFQDQNSAAGRGYQNQVNDFASRGTLQSSLYGTALDNLVRQLNEQKSSVGDSRSKFLSDIDAQQAQYATDNQFSQQSARAEALARRASGFNLGAV